jgi:GAF domain-containing protein
MLREATGEAGRVLKEHGHRLEVGGQSMVGYATSRRRPRIALDVGKEAVRFANPLLPDTRSEIALPLLVGDRVLGALDAQSTREAAFDDASAAVLQSMADQIAIALTNAEQFRRAESQAQAQARLLVATSDLVRQQDRQTLVNEMARNVVSLLAADGAEVWLPVGDDELERVAVSGALSSEHVGRRLGRGQGVAGRALVTGQTLRVDDVRAWAEHTPLHSEALFHAALAVPMLSPTQAAGVLVATRSQAGRPFTPDDERLTQLFATQAAVALSNLDLLEQQQRTLAELDAINRRLTSESYAAYYTRLPETARSTQFTRNNTSPIEPSAWLPEVELAVISKKPVAWSGREEQTVTSPFQAAMAAPIVLRGEVIGALQVGEANRSRPWAVEDLELIQSVADQVALAVENTRLFEEAQRTAYRERVVAEAADKIHRPVDLQAVLHAAIEEVQRVTGATQVGIRLGVADTDRDGNGNGRAPGSTGG